MSQLFRSAAKTESRITVSEEIAYAQKYLELHQIRFSGRLRADFDIVPGAGSLFIIRNILQPLVENYVLHGFDQRREDNWISVSATISDGFLVFEICDNGKGIAPDKLETISRLLRSPDQPSAKGAKERIGLPNVARRIWLIYGPDCGLSIESVPGNGSVVTVRIKTQLPEV